MQKKIKAFNKNGYWIEKDFFSLKEIKEQLLTKNKIVKIIDLYILNNLYLIS